MIMTPSRNTKTPMTTDEESGKLFSRVVMRLLMSSFVSLAIKPA